MLYFLNEPLSRHYQVVIVDFMNDLFFHPMTNEIEVRKVLKVAFLKKERKETETNSSVVVEENNITVARKASS